jgi:hypothetical protein
MAAAHNAARQRSRARYSPTANAQPTTTIHLNFEAIISQIPETAAHSDLEHSSTINKA